MCHIISHFGWRCSPAFGEYSWLSVRCWWARPPEVFVCSTQPFVWWFGDWTRLGLAKWWLDKRLNIYMYAHIRHTISAHGDTGNSTTCSTVCSDQHYLKNSSTLCIYGLVQVETSGKRWFPHRRLSVRKRVCVKTSSYSLVTADALALKKDRSYACKMPAALHMITSSYWYIFCVTGLISGKSMGARLRWDMMTSQHGKFFALLILCYANPPLTYNHRNENIFQSRYDLRDKINNKTTV